MSPTDDYEPIPLVVERLSVDDQLARSETFLETMKRRRSVRKFSREPVPLDLIRNAIATAGRAPSGANQQPWTFVVVGDPGVKRKIREAAEEEERISYGGRMSQEWIDALAHLGTNWQKPHLEEAPYLIVVFEQAYGLVSDPTHGEQQTKHYYVRESVGIAVGFLLAALHYSGLATLTHTPSPMGFLSSILGRPRNERAFVVIPVGYPAADCTVPKITKKPLDDIMVVI
jgi:iodotyrosine deiodinase